MQVRIFITALIFSLSSLQCALAADDQGVHEGEISLGTVQALTGAGSPTAASTKNLAGINALIEKINREGGINGRKLKLLVRDGQYKEEASLDLTKKLEEQDGVFALIAPFGTPFMIASRPYINRKQIPVIGPIDGDSRSRVPVNPTIFWLVASFDQEASSTLDLIKKVYKTDEFALYRAKNPLGESMRLQYVKWAHEKGMKILASVEEGPAQGENADAIKSLAAAHPKVTILAGNAKSNIAFLKAAMGAGLKSEWIVNAASMTSEFYNGVGREAGPVLMTSGIQMDDQLEIFRDYAAEMKKNHEELDPASYQGYVACAIFAEALKRVGPTATRSKLVEALNSMHDTSLGGLPITYSPDDHSGRKDIFFYRTGKEGFSLFKPN